MINFAKIHKVFKTLEGRGFTAPRKAWQCCQGCGLAALPEGTVNYVFYHQQDRDHAKKGGPLYLAWGGDGQRVDNELRAAGFDTIWDGTERQRIAVVPK